MNQILNRIELWTLRKSAKERYKGIVLCDLNFNDADDYDFLRRTKEALDLIEARDPRRFRRVQQEVRYITNIELNSCGTYRLSTKCCSVDFGKYPFDKNADWYRCCYAGLLVHEATHGSLFAKGFPYNPSNREQIERICHAEAQRFMRRAAPHWSEALSKGFDLSRWHFAWHASKWQQLRGILVRIKQSRKANQASDATSEPAPGAASSSPQG